MPRWDTVPGRDGREEQRLVGYRAAGSVFEADGVRFVALTVALDPDESVDDACQLVEKLYGVATARRNR